jgi:hypothetical protein
MYAGAVGALFFPPVGAIIGSMGGYIIAAQIYQSSIALLKHTRLIERESFRIVALAEESCKATAKERAKFELQLEKILQLRRKEFADCFAVIDQGLQSDHPDIATLGLAAFALLFGKKLISFKEFDEFMMNSTDTLVI